MLWAIAANLNLNSAAAVGIKVVAQHNIESNVFIKDNSTYPQNCTTNNINQSMHSHSISNQLTTIQSSAMSASSFVVSCYYSYSLGYLKVCCSTIEPALRRLFAGAA